jgi:O-antigen/teichoic acid export membrane protein
MKLTGWFMALKIVDTANASIDMILLGYFAGPRYVTAYALSRYLMLAFSMFCNSAFNATTPGLSKLYGEKNYAALLTARGQLLSLLWISLTTAGAIVCLWNKSFIGLWTSPEYFAGQIETFLIVFLVVLKSMREMDGSIIVIALEAKRSATIGVIAAIITIVFAWLLIPHYQTVGLLLSLLAGTISMCVSYSYYAARLTQLTASFFISTYLSRTSVVCIFILAICGFLGNYVNVDSWAMLIGAMSAAFIIIAAILWFFAWNADDRKKAITNFSSISFFKAG